MIEQHECGATENSVTCTYPSGLGFVYCAICGENTGVGGTYEFDPVAWHRYCDLMNEQDAIWVPAETLKRIDSDPPF